MPAENTFASYGTGPTTPPSRIALVTPNDAEDLEHVTRAISFAAEGAIKVTTLGGDEVIIPAGALAPGVQHTMYLTRIWSTGTTPDMGIVAYW